MTDSGRADLFGEPVSGCAALGETQNSGIGLLFEDGVMKRILVLGVGAQGSTVAQRLDEEPSVEKVLCADYDPQAVDELVKVLDKAEGFRVDASKREEIVEIARGADLIVNALPLNLTGNALEAALEVGANYQDFATTDSLCPPQDYLRNYDILFEEYGPRFEAIDKTAVIATGAAPGLIHVAAREAMKYLDSCETITLLVYEGVAAKRFLPFWWSPETAIGDMGWDGYSFEDGKVRSNTAHSRPVYRKFKGFNRSFSGPFPPLSAAIDRPHHDVFKDCHFKEGLYKLIGPCNTHVTYLIGGEAGYFLSFKVDITAVRSIKRCDDIEQSGFASTIWTDKPHYLFPLQVEIHVYQDLKATKVFTNTVQMKDDIFLLTIHYHHL